LREASNGAVYEEQSSFAASNPWILTANSLPAHDSRSRLPARDMPLFRFKNLCTGCSGLVHSSCPGLRRRSHGTARRWPV
jgi:hypothetical protein